MAPLLYCSLLFLAFILVFKFLVQRTRLKNLPPCPPTIPLIGNLHHLKPPLHRSLHKLSQKYGPIFSLWFGSRFVVVITSPSLVQECFTKHDIVLANRPRFLTGKYLFYNYTAVGSSPYGEHWRNLRRIITIDVLSRQRLNSFFEVRREETMRVIQKLVRESCKGFSQVRLRPLLRLFDFDGLEKRLKCIGTRADSFLQGLLEEHRSGKHKSNTMIEHLLTMQQSQPEYYSDQIIKGLIQAMLLAGTDTTAVTIEWAMASLLNHPEILTKAKDEIDTCIGQDRLVDESDIPKSSLPSKHYL